LIRKAALAHIATMNSEALTVPITFFGSVEVVVRSVGVTSRHRLMHQQIRQ
jgi:hypothetical protein